jgi:hypothetical protein
LKSYGGVETNLNVGRDTDHPTILVKCHWQWDMSMINMMMMMMMMMKTLMMKTMVHVVALMTTIMRTKLKKHFFLGPVAECSRQLVARAGSGADGVVAASAGVVDAVHRSADTGGSRHADGCHRLVEAVPHGKTYFNALLLVILW